MNDSHDNRLRKILFDEIDRLERTEAQGHVDLQDKRLGAFVDAALSNAQRTRSELAKTLRMDSELLDAILDGVLTGNDVTDATLVEIATALNCEPNLLRLLMGRAVEPMREARRSK